MQNNYSNILLPQVNSGAKIGVLGGAFDPPHLGHALLALSFLALEPIDQLWVIPCANHAYKPSLSPFPHRLSMCELAFGRLKKISVVDIENNLASPSFTIQTLAAIKSLRPDLKLIWALGSDLIPSFSSWHQAEKLETLADFVIFKRQNYPTKPLPFLLKNTRLHQGFILPDTSSTELREFLRVNKNSLECPFLDRLVFNYIKQHGLYR
jgi:nicotinate-nucleotide adenylyltransferase